MEENSERIVLCGANAYEQKYYFNEKFNGIPESIKEELHIICVLFTEEVGGVFTIVFEKDGSVSIETDAYEEDILYDQQWASRQGDSHAAQRASGVAKPVLQGIYTS